MFPSLAARGTYVAKANLRLGSKEMFLNQVKNIFASQLQILLPKRMFPNLATQGNMSGNYVSAGWTSGDSLCRHVQEIPVYVIQQHST